MLVVPTVALAKEYQNTIIKHEKDLFKYKIFTSIDESKEYDFVNNDNLFILTHEKAITNSSYQKLERIDFLVIDEVYKLDTRIEGDRTLLLNVAFYFLTKKAEKYCLLAPFIKNVANSDKLEKQPKMVSIDYSPVCNFVKKIDINNSSERFTACLSLIKDSIKNKKTLIYVPSPEGIADFVDKHLINEPDIVIDNQEISNFIDWAEEEIHPDWSLVKALKKGYLVHNGAIPFGIRDYLLSVFNTTDNEFNKLLCTSTLLEGVNTQAEYLIITKPSRFSFRKGSSIFSSFDFYNLVGRTGRLYKYYVGYCYYIKDPNDRDYLNKNEARIEVEFELTENTDDIDIQINSAKNSDEVREYFSSIGLSPDDYVKKVGSPMRLNTFKTVKKNYDNNKKELIKYIEDGNSWQVVNHVSKIVYVDNTESRFNPGMIYKILSGKNRKLRLVIEDLLNDRYISENFTKEKIINNCLRIKNGYLEHKMLNRTKVIALLMELDKVDKNTIDKLLNCINRPIEMMYKLNSPAMKMLRSIGVYESDLETIIDSIGDDFSDLTELKERLILEYKKYIDKICFVSSFEIKNFIGK